MSSDASKPDESASAGKSDAGRIPNLDGMQGPIGKPRLADLLRRASEAGFSGVLYLRRGDNRRRLYMAQGALALASSTVPGERLGDVLLARGDISAQTLRTMHEKSKVDGRSVLELLEAGGLITATEHAEILCRTTEKIMFQAGTWTDGEWELMPGKLPQEVARPSGADLLIWAAILTSYDDWRKVYQTLGDPQTSLLLKPEALKQNAYKELSFAAKQLLSLCSRERTVQQVARGRVMSQFDELLTLTRSVELGLLTITRAARSEDTRPSDVAEPDNTLPLDRSPSKVVAEAVEVVSQTASAAANRPRPVSDGDELLRRKRKAQELRDQAAEQSKGARDIQRPFELLQQAMQLDPESTDLLIAAAELLMRNPKRMDEAQEYCRKALASQPDNPRVLVALAKTQIAVRDLEGAKQSLGQAVPNDGTGEAARLLSTLTRPVGQPTSPRPPVQLSAPSPSRFTMRMGSPAPEGSLLRRFLGTLLVVGLLGAWGFGMYELVVWRLDVNLGPLPEQTVLDPEPK